MNALSFLNPTDPLPEEVIAAQDRPQRFTFSGIWELPFGRARPLPAARPAGSPP